MGSALHAMAPLCVANTLGVLKRPAAIAALKTLPVRFLHSLQYRRLPSATWACDPIFAFGTASTGRLYRQVRILIAIQPREIRQPARLKSRNRTAPSSRLLSLVCDIGIGGDVRCIIPSATRGLRPPNRGRQRKDTTARAAQRVRRSLLLLRGSSFSLRVRRAPSGSLRRGGGAVLVIVAPRALLSKPASAFLALVLAAFASRRVRIHAND